MGLGYGLGEAVAFHVMQSGHLQEASTDGRRQRRSTTSDAFQSMEIIVSNPWVRQKINHHSADVGPAGASIPLYQVCGGVSIPPSHQHHGCAQVDGGIHAPLHTGHMKEG